MGSSLASLVIREILVGLRWDVILYLVGRLLARQQKIASVGKDVERLESLGILGGTVEWCNIIENSMDFPQQIKNRNIIQFSNPTSRNICRRIGSRVSKRYLHTHVHRSTTHKSREVKASQVSGDA